MTTLLEKFEALETQLSTQNTALQNALDSILTALGAPPPTATVTLADTLAMMVALNNNVIGMAIANGTYHAAVLEALGQLSTNTDLMITNNSLNAQRMLAMMVQVSCPCPSDAPLLDNPLDVTPTTLADEAKCRRIQYFLSVFGALVDEIANYASTGAALTSAALVELVTTAVTAAALTGGEVGAVAGPPGIVVGAIVAALGTLAALVGSAYIYTLSIQWHQAPLGAQLQAALYSADNAEAGTAAFYAVINASGVLDTVFKPVLNVLWWNGWSNDIYSGVPTVDDSAFDGTICAPPPDESCIVQNVPGDEGTTTYEFESNTYSRCVPNDMSFFSRLTNDTTLQPSIRVYCSSGAIGHFLEADELITWGDLFAAIGGAYPNKIDSALPSAGYTIEWCNLGPLV
jgi:hypothetical protein